MSDRKVAIVTGSATGVGAATALELAGRGYNLLINFSKSEAEAKASQAACQAAGADTVLVQGDVANWEALDTATFERIYGVNVIGAFQMVRACLPQLKAGGGGSIVNVSSIAGALGIGSSVAYIASKGALNALTLHLARTLAPEVRVNAVCPGLISTRWFVDGVGQENADQIQAQFEKAVPLQTACTAEDVAEAIVWLVTGARTTTGELLMLDGGMHLGRATPRP